MKLAIVGSRSYRNYDAFRGIMNAWFGDTKDIEVVSGGAAGVDTLAEKWAIENQYPIRVFPADWETHGKKAGFLRNQDIVNGCDAVVAFWDRCSKGTKHTINLACDAKKPTLIIYV